MPIYEPIRDSFRELNRMLLDSQQWDEQHTKSQMDNEYKHAVLKSNIAQREFENTMAESSFVLRQRGEDRMAADLELRTAGQAFDHKLRSDAAGRDVIAMGDAHQESIQRRAEGARRAAEDEHFTEPREINFKNALPKHMQDDPEVYGAFMTELNTTLGESGMAVGTDGIAFGGQGETVLMSLKNQQQFAPLVNGLLAKYDDPNINAKIKIDQLMAQQGELKKQASASGDNYNMKERAEARRGVNKTEALMIEQMETFRPMNAKKDFMRRSETLTQMAMWQRERGMEDQAAATDSTAFEFLQKATAADAASKGQKVPLWSRELTKKGKALQVDMGTYDPISTQITVVDPETGESRNVNLLAEGLQTVPPTETFGKKKDAGPGGLTTEQQMTNVKSFYESEGIAGGILGSDPVKPKIRQLGNMITLVHQNDFGGAEDKRNLAKQEVIRKVEDFETLYWSEVDDALAMRPKDRKEFLIDMGVKYDPKKSHKDQIKNYFYLTKFRPAIRKMVGDPEYMVFRPNLTTKRMTLGKSGMGDR